MTALWILVAINWLMVVALGIVVAGVLRYLGSVREVIQQAIPRITQFSDGDPLPSFVFAWHGTADEVTPKALSIVGAPGIVVLLDEEAKLASDFLVGSLPVGLAIDAGGRIVSQSANPGPNWLYRTLKAAAPAEPLEATWVAEITTRA